MALRAKRSLAVATASVLLAGGAALTTATEASAAPAHAPSTVGNSQHHRVWHPGHWTKQWHPGHWRNVWHHGYWDHHHHWHHGWWSHQWIPGHWTRMWHPGHWTYS